MVQLSSVPRQQSFLKVAKAKSFSFGLWFRTKDQDRQFGSPVLPLPQEYQGIDITGDTVRLVVYKKPHLGGTVMINELATLVEPEHGYCRVDLQGEDTDIAVGTYDFSITWVAENYSGVVVQGELEIFPNGEIDSLDDPDYTIDPPLHMGVVVGETNMIKVVIDHLRAPDLDIGSVTTVPYGEAAGAYFSGAYPHQLLNLTIPSGEIGPPADLIIGDVTVGANENDYSVTIEETDPGVFELDIKLPRSISAAQGGRLYLDSYPTVVGNGATDDRVAIQAVLDSLDAFGGGTVELGLKDYGILGVLQVPNGVWLEGLGREASGFIMLDGTSKIAVGVWGDGDRPGGLRKLGVDGNSTGDPEGIVHFQSVMAQMQDCYVHEAAGDNILLDAAQNAVIQGCFSTAAGDAALAIRNGSGGYNFLGSHFTNSQRNLKIYDDDGSLNNAYPFGSAHIQFWGGIIEQYVDGELLFDIECSGALHFWGTGFSANGAITLSEGVVGRVGNAAFPLISTFVEFNGCTWNGGTNEYVGVEIVGPQYVTFSGENYIQKHTTFCLVSAGSPRIQQLGFFSGKSDVGEIFGTSGGGSLVSLYNERDVSTDYIMPVARPTILSSRLEGDAGHRFRIEATGKHVFNEGDDFGTQQYFEYDETVDDLLHTSVHVAGRLSAKPAAPVFANGAVNLDVKLRAYHQIVLTGTGHADPVTLTNGSPGAMAWINVYATAGQSLTWAADMVWPGGGAGPSAPGVGKTLSVFAMYDDVLSKWVCNIWSDDAAVTGDYVETSLFDANSLLIANSDNTPEALAVAASTLVGRAAAGGINDLSVADVKTLLAYVASDIGSLSEYIDDRVDALVTDGTGIRSTYDDTGNLLTLSVPGAGFNNQVGTTYSLVLADAGKWVTLGNANPITLTVPNSSTQAFTVGDEIDLLAAGNGQITITPAGGVSVSSRGGRLKTNGLYSVFGLKYLGSNFWIAYGDLTT